MKCQGCDKELGYICCGNGCAVCVLTITLCDECNDVE